MPLLVFLIFVIGGPPIGFAVLLLESFLLPLTGITPHAVASGPWQAPRFREVGLLLGASFVFGGAQAVLTSLVATLSFGFSDYTRVSLTAVSVTAVLAGLGFVLLLRGPVPWGMAAGLMVVHVGAALGCWLLAAAVIRLAGRPADPAPSHDAYFARAED